MTENPTEKALPETDTCTLLSVAVIRGDTVDETADACGIHITGDNSLEASTEDFQPILEMKSQAGDNLRVFEAGEGEPAVWILDVPDTPYAMMIEMDPGTKVRCDGMFRLSIRPRPPAGDGEAVLLPSATLSLADEIMLMAGAVAAATSEDGASLLREAAFRLRTYASAAHLSSTDDMPHLRAAIEERLAEKDGLWRSCSGCHELNEGHDTGMYSEVFGCHLGGGCSECGGIGAVWDSTDYVDMAGGTIRQDRDHENVKRILVSGGVFPFTAAELASEILALYAHPPATPNSGAEDGVTQGDRILARQIASWVNGLSGKEAESFSASAIARHRLTSANTASERDKALVEMVRAHAGKLIGNKSMWGSDGAYRSGVSAMAGFAIDAIRSLSHTKGG